jgi:hypothetical protein
MRTALHGMADFIAFGSGLVIGAGILARDRRLFAVGLVVCFLGFILWSVTR